MKSAVIGIIALATLQSGEVWAQKFDIDKVVAARDKLSQMVAVASKGHCHMTSAVAPQVMRDEQKRATFANLANGAIFIPKNSKAESLIDIDQRLFCRPIQLFGAEVPPTRKGPRTALNMKVGVDINVKLGIGEFLNLVNVDLSDIDEIGVDVEAVVHIMDENQKGKAGVDAINEFFCANTIREKGNISQAVMVTTNCTGRLRVRFKTKQSVSIKSLDLTFFKLFSGLLSGGASGSWVREISGGIEECTAKPKPTTVKPGDKPAKDEVTAAKGKGTDTDIEFEFGGVKIGFDVAGQDEYKITLKNSKPALVKNTKAEGAAKPETAKPDSQKGDDQKAKPVDIEQDCTDGIYYETPTAVVYGIDVLPVETILKAAQKYIDAQKK